MADKLKNIVVDEISIVDSGANKKKRFYIIKMDDEDFEKKLMEFCDVKNPEDFSLEKILDEDAKKTIGDAIRILTEYKSDMPADVLIAIQNLVKIASASLGIKVEEKPEEDEEKNEVEKRLDEIEERIGTRKSKNPKENIDKIPIPVVTFRNPEDEEEEEIVELEKEDEDPEPEDKESPEHEEWEKRHKEKGVKKSLDVDLEEIERDRKEKVKKETRDPMPGLLTPHDFGVKPQ